MSILDILKNKLENVSDSYFEFVDGIIFDCDHYKEKNSRIAEELLDFIEKNPNANSSDILEYQLDLIGVPYCDDDAMVKLDEVLKHINGN